MKIAATLVALTLGQPPTPVAEQAGPEAVEPEAVEPEPFDVPVVAVPPKVDQQPEPPPPSEPPPCKREDFKTLDEFVDCQYEREVAMGNTRPPEPELTEEERARQREIAEANAEMRRDERERAAERREAAERGENTWVWMFLGSIALDAAAVGLILGGASRMEERLLRTASDSPKVTGGDGKGMFYTGWVVGTAGAGLFIASMVVLGIDRSRRVAMAPTGLLVRF